jgi:hypothetical protein
MDQYGQGLLVLLLGGMFALFLWWNHQSGVAILRLGIEADRRRHPIGFWFIQAIMFAFAAMCVFFGVASLFGLLGN